MYDMAPRAWLRRISTALNDHPRASAFLVLLVPGLSLKRWLALGVFGLGAIALGIVFALELSLGPRFHSIVGLLSLRESSATVRGGVFIAIGVVGAVFAVFGLGRSLSRVRLRRRDRTLLD